MKKFIILIPVYNDWKSVFKLLENIDAQTEKWDAEVFVLVVEFLVALGAVAEGLGIGGVLSMPAGISFEASKFF